MPTSKLSTILQAARASGRVEHHRNFASEEDSVGVCPRAAQVWRVAISNESRQEVEYLNACAFIESNCVSATRTAIVVVVVQAAAVGENLLEVPANLTKRRYSLEPRRLP